MSTLFDKRGNFHEEWTMGEATWKRVRIKAPECPRISAALLEKERTSLGKWSYAQEYLYEFLVMVDQVFSYESVMGAITPEVKPLSGALAVASVPGGPGPRPEPELRGPIHEGVGGGIAVGPASPGMQPVGSGRYCDRSTGGGYVPSEWPLPYCRHHNRRGRCPCRRGNDPVSKRYLVSTM